MSTISQVCTICGKSFSPQFSYQMEERTEPDADGQPRVRFAFYCTQTCLERSHQRGDDGSVCCDACGASFQVELASQVVFVRGRRHYACSTECRAQVLAEAHGARLGDSLPARPVVAVESSAEASSQQAVTSAEPSSQQVVTSAEPPARAPVIPLPAGRGGQSSARPQVIAAFNHKGGTGKTTTAVTVAAGLAARGQRVLLVDTDSQGNVAVSLDLKSEQNLYHVLVLGLALGDAVVSARPGLDVLTSNETLAAAELYLAGRRNRDQVLAGRLAESRAAYDVIVVDCSPSLSLMNQNALCFADAVLCPVACDYLSLVGVRQVLRTIKQVNRHLGHPVDLWGVLPTMFDARAKICHEALDTLRQHFGARCLEPIRATIRVKEAPAQGRTVLEHAPESGASEDYLAVVDKLLADRAASTQTVPERPRKLGGMP